MTRRAVGLVLMVCCTLVVTRVLHDGLLYAGAADHRHTASSSGVPYFGSNVTSTTLRVADVGAVRTRRPGRNRIDYSHLGLQTAADGVIHAWAENDSHRCHGARALPRCVANSTLAYLAEHVMLAIVTGREDTFRVEISYCSWLRHFPVDRTIIVSDVVPPAPHTPHRWVAGRLPDGVVERDGDLFSEHVRKGYVRAVRSAGQGYSASWIVAQFRFPQALQELAQRFKEDDKLRWGLLVDDDTIVNANHLVERVSSLNYEQPWYLSRKGWGGAGHLYSRAALQKLGNGIHECVDRWMVRQFRASDAMLFKCAGHLKLKSHLEGTMTHCPASHLREKLIHSNLATLHAKKDMYPPVLLATWRSALYYYGAVCKSRDAAQLAIEYSACAFGSCKNILCDKSVDARREQRWLELSRNNTITTLPFPVV